jgi:VanZ family protein
VGAWRSFVESARTKWTRFVIKFCSVAATFLLVIVALGPAKWQPRTGLGWEIEHFVGYFVFTSMFCLAWPRPLVVGTALMAFAVLLEGLQALTPDRSSNLLAALYGAGGVLAAALLAELFIRARRRLTRQEVA